MGRKEGRMKLATFLLGVLAVNAQTQDPRRKKWKDIEPTTVDWTTTTTTTSTESTTTTSTTTSTTTRTTRPTTPPKFNLPSSEDALPNGTKELQTGMFGEHQATVSADPDVSAAATNHGFNFGSGLSTKGIGTVDDETRGAGGKKNKKNKKDKKDKTKDKKDKPKKDKPKKDKKPKEGKKKKKIRLTAASCFEAIGENFFMTNGAFKSGKSTNNKKPSIMYDCDGDMVPTHRTITCFKDDNGIQFKINPA